MIDFSKHTRQREKSDKSTGFSYRMQNKTKKKSEADFSFSKIFKTRQVSYHRGYPICMLVLYIVYQM